ncbi:GNAT family N-acetyltransferase [Belliella sp. R4-6]|uniref:GNAT family N-acetyltransferase n=1 Tax=Belliella alkalica TaxID=1730871 RepID=A0ABS9VF00_9BACT|nr:GNAT family N-acetyltransferase [Belliella alkalica]MCH7414988.1 GNAT family N-acetyltransferase [Belliella alkalica]
MYIRTATLADIPKIVSLLKLSLGEQMIPKSEAFWMWKHIENPFGESLSLVAEDKGEIVAVRAFMKWEWIYQSRTFKALRAVDTAVHPLYQGKGLFTKLTRMLVEKAKLDGYDFIFNTPNKKSLVGYCKMGWVKSGRIPVTIQFNSFFVGKKQNELLDIDENLFIDTIKKIKFSTNGIRKKIDHNFLKWRYLDCPVHDYRFYTDGEFFMFVYRLKRKSTWKEMRIVELFFLKEMVELDLKEIFKRIQSIQTTHQVNYTTIIGSEFEVKMKGVFTISKVQIGPILTIKDLNLKGMKSVIFEKANWDYKLGDLELF